MKFRIASGSMALLTIAIAASAVCSQAKRFEFGSVGIKRIGSEDVYLKEHGFGFELAGSKVTCSADRCSSDRPFYFSVAVPEGNYQVTVTLGSKTAASNTTVKAEMRRLMLENITTRKGELVTKTFIVNVRRPSISTGGEVKLKDRERTLEQWAWDEKLTLEFGGTHPSISAFKVEPVNVPTVFLLGDSTVCDQPAEPYASWGQMLTRFFKPQVAVSNNAESGESTKSAIAAKRLDKVLSQMKRGDYLLIQYGHNDEKDKSEGAGAFTTYKSNLKLFVNEARKKGGVPILITPVQRRTFDANGKITNSHGDFPDAVRQLAKEENVPLVDLHSISTQFYEALGPHASALAFKESDGTHHNNYGAYQLARSIAQALRGQKIPLAKYIRRDVPGYDPGRPDPAASFSLPASPAVTATKPPGS